MNQEPHTFLLFPGFWLGKGLVVFRNIKEKIPFSVSWEPLTWDEKKIVWEQKIFLSQFEDTVTNALEVHKEEEKFQILLKTIDFEALGLGFIEGEEIFWSYKGSFCGKESYIREDEDHYRFFANYVYPEEETSIEGHIFRNKKNI